MINPNKNNTCRMTLPKIKCGHRIARKCQYIDVL